MSIFYLLVFPGFLFLSALGLFMEYFDRKVYARMQNRVGPPWYQPLADIIKLVSKETIIPYDTNKKMFAALPVIALAAATTAIFYIPIWSSHALFSFTGDIIVVLYLLTIPTLPFFLAGWNSNSLFAGIGAVRNLTQLFSYEVPLYMGLLAPAFLASSWSLSEISQFYTTHPLLILLNIPAFIVCIIAVQGKLERVPFDIPDAETEIVAGSFTEYSGRYFAIFRMALDTELVVAATLLAAVFIPVFVANPFISFLIYFGYIPFCYGAYTYGTDGEILLEIFGSPCLGTNHHQHID